MVGVLYRGGKFSRWIPVLIERGARTKKANKRKRLRMRLARYDARIIVWSSGCTTWFTGIQEMQGHEPGEHGPEVPKERL